MAAPAGSEQTFVSRLASLTGLDPKVIQAWVNAEGAYAPNGTGGYNFLNIREGTSRSGVAIAGTTSKGFAHFRNASDAATETASWINSMPNYSGIRSATKLGPLSQLAAIAASPWDSSHYGGGKNLYNAYGSVTGKTLSTGGIWGGIKTGLGTAGSVISDAANPVGSLGSIPGVKDIPGVSQAAAIIDAPKTIAEDAGKVLGFIFNPEDWLRIGYILGGGVLIVGGLFILARSVGTSAIQSQVKQVVGGGGGQSGEYEKGREQGRRAAARREGRKAGMSEVATAEDLRPRPVYRGKASRRSDEIPF